MKLWPNAKKKPSGAVTRDGKRIVLVTGAPRSGTTALVELLNCHPDLAITCERYSRLLRQGRIGVEHFSIDRLRTFEDGDGSAVSFGMDVMRNALVKLETAKIVGDKMPMPRDIFKLAQDLGNVPVIAILREPQGMAESYMGRVRRADMQIAAGKTPTWQPTRDYRVAVREFNDYVALLRDMSASRSGGSAPWLLVEYGKLFSGDYSVEQIYEFLDLDPSRAIDVDGVLKSRDPKRREADDIKQFVGLHADYAGYRQVFDRMGLAGKDMT